MPYGCWPFLLLLLFILLLPFFLADVMITALGKLGLTPQQSILAAMGIFIGGLINLPLTRLERDQPVTEDIPGMFGIGPLNIGPQQRKTYTVISVNLGGCLIPTLLVIYEIQRLSNLNPSALIAVIIAAAVNIGVCYKLAKPVPNKGIALPPLVPALLAASMGIILNMEYAPAIAFVSGVMGPLVGADLLHLRDISKISTGMASIGGAGTFDSIVLSGILATILA